MQVCVISDGVMPKKGTSNSAGFDLYSPSAFRIYPNAIAKINTKVKIAVPPGTYAQIYSRSGLAVNGVVVIAGTIDADYRGFVVVALHNITNEVKNFEAGTRIAQLILHKINYEPAVQWTYLPDDAEFNQRECLPLWYVNDVRTLLMEEVRTLGQYNDVTNNTPVDFSKFKKVPRSFRVNRNQAIREVRGAGGFGSTGEQ
jgi:dUTP pyrophosphatase